MFHNRLPLLLIVPALAASALGVAACGGDDDRAEQVREKAADVSQRGADLQEVTKRAAADVKAGRKTQAEADAEIKRQADEIIEDAGDVTKDAIDIAKDDDRMPDEAKKALEDAQKQIDTATP